MRHIDAQGVGSVFNLLLKKSIGGKKVIGPT
jgi:hypothetical protein